MYLIKQCWPHQIVMKCVSIYGMFLVPGNTLATCLWMDSEGDIFKPRYVDYPGELGGYLFLPLKTVCDQLRSQSHQVIQSLAEVIVFR